MARKRMFDIEILNQDSFLDLPMEAKALYFLLGMEADDEGFVSPKKVLRLYGGTDDSIKILICKGYLIPFESGVVVITDWKRNNYLDKTRIKETIYLEEKNQIYYDSDKEKYVSNIVNMPVKEMLNKCETNVKQMLNQNSIEENSIEENSIKKASKSESYDDILSNVDEDLKQPLYEFIKMRKLIKKPLTNNALKLAITKLKSLSGDKQTQIDIINQSIMNSWQGFFPLKEHKKDNQETTGNYFLDILKKEGGM